MTGCEWPYDAFYAPKDAMNRPTFSSAPLPKRKRLSYACNYCRVKKTRCDEQFPSCRNCQQAGVPCVTVDKRRPNAPVQQRRKDLPAREGPLGTVAPEHTIGTALVSPETTGASRSPSLGAPEFVLAPALSRSPSPIQTGSQQWVTTSWDTRHLPVMPTRAVSSLAQISTQWLDLALSRLRIPRSHPVRASLILCLSTLSTGGEYTIPSVEPGLPPLDELHSLIELFFKVYHPIYPFLDRQMVLSLVSEASHSPQHHPGGRVVGKVPQQMLLYLITILGSMASLPVPHQRINTYLAYCHTLVGHLMLHPVLESVQALLLFSITLRLRDQLSPAWHVLMLAVSISQTLNLGDPSVHRQPKHESVSDGDRDPMRTWWALYVFEKFLAFDSGRKSKLDDPELSPLGLQAPTGTLQQGEMPRLQGYELYMTSLANVLHELQHRSWQTWREESFRVMSEEEARASKIRAAGAIDTLLQKWRESLAPEYQIGTSSAADVLLTPQWAFLSFYYLQAIIVLYRNVLLLDWNELKREVDRYGSGKVWHLRLRNGPQLCLEAAKEMTNLQVMVTEAGEPSFLSLGTSALAAAYVLVVHIRRQPGSILSRTHSELMKVAMSIARQRHPSDGPNCSLHKTFDTLEEYVAQLLVDPTNQSAGEPYPEPVENGLSPIPIPTAALPNLPDAPPLTWASFEWLGWDWNGFVPEHQTM